MNTEPPRIQAQLVPARQGWDWVKQGWQLLRLQPMTLTGILAMYLFVMLLVSAVLSFVEQGLARFLPGVLAQLLAGLGAACFAATVPGMTAGFMAICRNILMKKPVQFNQILQPFKGKKSVRNGLLILGAVQVIALTLAVAITPRIEVTEAAKAAPVVSTTNQDSSNTKPQAVDQATNKAKPPAPAVDPALTPTVNPSADPQLEGMSLEQRQRVLSVTLLQMLIYMPVTILLWYAPMLVYWHECGPVKAMFFSVAAVWRNRAAFTIYGLALSLILFLAAFAMALVLALAGQLLGIGQGALALLAPFVMALLTWTYCTVYFSYTSVFGDPSKSEETVVNT